MGYETNYTVKVHAGHLPRAPWPYELEDVAEKLTDISGGYSFSVWNGGIISDSIKWYDYADDVAELVEFLASVGSDAALAVYGVGEEHPDIWVHYFYPDGTDSGQLKAEIIYPPDPRRRG